MPIIKKLLGVFNRESPKRTPDFMGDPDLTMDYQVHGRDFVEEMAKRRTTEATYGQVRQTFMARFLDDRSPL